MNIEYNDNMNRSVSAIIVSYNGGSLLYENLLKHALYLDSIIIVDNGSTDEETCRILNKIEFDRVATVVRLKDNYGVGYALNRGVELALRLGKEWIITFDQDSTPLNDIAHIMILFANQQLLSSGDVSILTPKIVSSTNMCIGSGSDIHEIVAYAITSGNLVRTRIFRELGFYNEDYFIDSVDFEFCLRAKKHGFKIYRVNEAILLHRLGSYRVMQIAGFSVKLISHSPLRRYYIFRNHFLLMATYWSVSPVLIAKKTISLLCMFSQILFFEDNKYSHLKMIGKGIADWVRNKRGRIDGFPDTRARISC